MKILAVGDIVGEAGVRKLKEELPKIKKEYNIDFVITNGENSAGGMGINERNFNDMLEAGTNVVTMGNHTWGKKDIFKFIDHPQLLRPANYPKGVVGKGLGIYECKGKKIAVMNFMGRVDINILTENPFIMARDMVNEIKDNVDMIIIDFHAEATAEKIAMARYLDGKITAIFGTHTHVQTADEKIYNNTAYITDTGMNGPSNGIIGAAPKTIIQMFREQVLHFKLDPDTSKYQFNAVMITFNNKTNLPTSIKRINLVEE